MTASNEPIAIVGSACRFPGGANSPSKLWELLRNPRDLRTKIPPSRFDVDGFHHPDNSFPGHSNVKHSHLLDENVRHFDSHFFSIAPAEASAMDPQQRLLLETVYEGLETSGFTIEGLRGSNTAVYVGVMFGDYENVQLRDLQHFPAYHATGTARSIMSNRVSYFFDWHGPSWTVDTACSSSLVAVHQAVQSLRSGEVNVAVAAGTNIILGPEPYVSESKVKMLSPDGRSRMWDIDANGYARGEGIAAVFLKTLSAALADGDNIECIIRETGVNQDGRSRGITMPSATAQAALIRETYARAGLDPIKDRCQYFEAHGTGTPAGDPVEAEAVHTAFFGHKKPGDEKDSSPLYVGSIKTIIGHTESTAGLAGVLKVAQALKHRFIPPNRLLNKLNPDVLPFYDHLKIPQELIPWPEVSPGEVRRASVNSFGFGGTNAHAIIESYETKQPKLDHAPAFAPFVFSAQSKQSLAANIAAYAHYLKENPETNPADLSWTLRSRRSRLPLRVTFPASSIEDLRSNLEELGKSFQLDPKLPSTGNDRSKFLGVFTGQGAQYARMGAELVETSAYASKVLSELDQCLSQLPEEDRPSIALRQELFEAVDTSRVATAAVSQPLCTAVQIILVDLLRLAGIRFSAVVGHSSGEIAAAYAAGYLSASDAIRIAYYRGLHTHLAAGENDSQGAMLAVGTSQEDANEICSDEQFKGRVNIAACNSPASVTLSGDEEAIEEIKVLFEDEGKFVRRLRVDKAYHSHHMLRCSQAYLDSIKRFSTISNTDGSCTWVSSVDPDRKLDNAEQVDASYWVDNMVSPVLFKQAVERASKLGPFDGAIEVGPHPALKGPVRETLQSLQVDIPYTGLLHRQKNAIQSFSGALGYLWSQVDNLKIDFDEYEKAFGGPVSYTLIKGLPAYQWNHPQEYWHESPLSQKFRQRSNTVHPLLGDLSPQSSTNQLIWKLVMRPKDLPWVHGHQVQGQTVFPAAGYVSTALETVPFIAGEDSVRLVEIENICIHQAMVLDNENEETGIDVQFSVNNINRGPEYIITHFTYEATIGSQGVFELISSGQLRITLGEASPETLPASSLDEPYMVPVPSDKFYSELKDIGYGYSGPFRALDSIKRKLWKASGSISVINDEPRPITYAVHPGLLDAAFHSVILALSYPGDRQLWSLHIPTSIDKIRFNPSLCGEYWLRNDKVPFVASAQDPTQVGGYQGDAEVHGSDGKSSAIQIEGLKVVPLSEATQADDREMFHLMHWIDAEANADMPEVYKATPKQRELANIFLRASCFYLREIQKQIPEDHPGRDDKFNAAYLDFAAHNTKLCQEGKHRYAKKEWLNDTFKDIIALIEPHSHLPEVRALNVVAEHMPRAIRGETNMVEQLLMTGLLDDYYATGLGYKEAVEALADTVKQIAQRYPNMSILEVGSGTGSATRLVFDRISHEFSNFTYTDISTGFFGNAQEEFKQHKDQMTYAVLDLEQDLQGQGFKKHSYDMILSSLVVHATKHLEDTMRRVRSLLKPGGYLVMTECTDVDASQVTTLFGCLPGWWLGMDEGRKWGPCISESDWDSLLRKVGFSGIETMTPTDDALVFPNSVIVSRAVDDWVDFVREPLLTQSSLFTGRPVIDSLFIVGGSTFRNSRLIDEIQRHIGLYCENITHVKVLESLDHTVINSNATVLVLQDLDQPAFQNITEERFESLKKLFSSEKSIIWVTQNRLSDNPYANLPVGFARSVLSEVAELRYQFIDFEGVHKIDARVLAEAVLRFEAAGSVRQQSQRNALWSVEQEIIINADGQQRIPRLKPYHQANDRFNSSRRNIIKQANPDEVSLEISKRNGRYIITEHSAPATALERSESTLRLKSSHTSSQAIKSPLGDAFVFLGNCTSTGAQYLGLTQSPASFINTARERLIPCSVPLGSEAAFVGLVATNLLLLTITGGLGKGDTLLINNPPSVLAILLNRQVSTTGLNPIYTSSSKTDSTEKGWLHVDQYHRQSHLKSILPREVSRFVDFASQPSPISSCLPNYTSILNSSVSFPEILAPHSSNSEFGSQLTEILTQTVHSALKDLETIDHVSEVSALINVQDLSGREATSSLAVIEWGASSIPVTVEPVKYQFRQDRTYWLVGLTGDMGLSIANWMIQSGARNLVLTSRNPKIEQSWLASAKSQGATVQVMKNDLIDFGDLERVHREIIETMPPIAGVAQGAMVMRDAATREMTFDELMQSLRPKVEGSLNLDRLFYDESLDFFVFFSSSASVIGHPGQANYTAGNAFMCGLAEQRRRRGLNASAINLGPVLGTGYITRELSQWGSQSAFERGFVTLSESDVHHTVAEAIHSSLCTSAVKSQVTTGLRHTPATDATRAQWYTFPQFSCMTLKEFGNGVTASGGQEGIPLSEQLTNATTHDEVRDIITDTFTAELRNMLMLGNDYELTPSVRTDELGLDSLVAVRLRSWFLNNFQVNIPVLKILKGVSIQNLVDQTLNEMPESLTPNIGNSNPSAPASSEQATSNNPSETASEKQETPPSSCPHTPMEELDKELKEEAAPAQRITRCGELSYSQSMFLFAHRLLNDKTTMNTTAMVNFRGDIRVSGLRQAIETIVKRHESLRTCFYEREGQFVQGVMESSPLTLEHKKIYNKQELFREYESLGKFVYDLSAGRAMRFILLSYSPRDHYFLLGYHHIIFDRTSQNTFMAELQQLYDGGAVPYQPLQYLDWSNRQHELYKAGSWKAMVDFWRREFITVPEPLPLHRSLISTRLPLEEYSFHTKQVRIHTETAGAVREVARKHRSTPFHLHLAIFKALLYRFLGSRDICIGVTDNGRMDDSMQTGIGPFVNTVFVRMSAGGEQTFGDAIKEARDKSISALSNPLPLELIFNVTQVTRASTHTPLGQAFLNYSEVELQDGEIFLGCKMTTMDQHPAKLPYDITCTVVNHGAGHTDVWLNVQQALYTEEDAQLLVHGYEDILAELTKSPTDSVGDEWRFRESTVQHALTVGRGPAFKSTWPQTLVHRFNDIATTFASRMAVKDTNANSLTYAELLQSVDAIASELLRARVQPGSRVAVFQHPSVYWAASVLAILKVGGVYVPLDASNPVARLTLIVQDSQPTAILVHEHTLANAEGLEAPPDTTIIDISQIPEQVSESVPILASPDSPAIILYTSGSTGVPKGVILQHASLKHEFDHCAATYGLDEHDVVLQQSAWSFDLSVTQIFLALGVGATLQIASHTMRPDARAMTDLIKTKGVTATYATPTEYKSWLRHENQQSLRSASWKLALVAGEAVTEPLLQLFRETDLPNHRLFNVYGPTETTCGSTKLELDYKTPGLYSKSVPVGRASANESFYILDRNQKPLPCGQSGEVAIAGVGMAMGYLNNEERTQASFLPDPYAPSHYIENGWTRMYRTGDLGFLQQDGMLILQGRIEGDTEVKLNGVRIDLGDIEQTVLKAANGSLSDAIASLRSVSDDKAKFMVVHVVFSSESSAADKSTLLDGLVADLPLPRTMRPSAIIPVDSLPRTVAGKVDRKAVSRWPIPGVLGDGGNTALSKAEAAMKCMWEAVLPDELLGLHQVNADSDFFAVGGSSMSLIELQNKIKEKTNVLVPLLQLFQTSSLRGMSGLIGSDELERSNQIDWDTEILLDPELASISTAAEVAPPRGQPRVVVLTGGTGFLGQHIARELSAQSHVEKIICVAMRNVSQKRAAFAGLDKIECHEGDLRLPRLGLSEEIANSIFQQADAVVHNGADVSHLKNYTSLRTANVQSTQELVKLCLPRKVPLHFVSSTGVSMYSDLRSFPEVSMRTSPPPTDGHDGYSSSKWVSEMYLENVHAAYGLPVHIHRPSSIIRPREQLTGDDPVDDVIQGMIEYSRRISAVPVVPGTHGTLDLVKPDTVAKKLVRAVMAQSPSDKVTYVHESGDLVLKDTEMADYVAGQSGDAVAEVPLEEWISRAQAAGLSKSLVAVFQGLGSNQLNFPEVLTGF